MTLSGMIIGSKTMKIVVLLQFIHLNMKNIPTGYAHISNKMVIITFLLWAILRLGIH
jgi:hypothetical protein